MKNENGQFQIVRVTTLPAATTGIGQNNTTTGLPAGSYRLTVPVVGN